MENSKYVEPTIKKIIFSDDYVMSQLLFKMFKNFEFLLKKKVDDSSFTVAEYLIFLIRDKEINVSITNEQNEPEIVEFAILSFQKSDGKNLYEHIKKIDFIVENDGCCCLLFSSFKHKKLNCVLTVKTIDETNSNTKKTITVADIEEIYNFEQKKIRRIELFVNKLFLVEKQEQKKDNEQKQNIFEKKNDCQKKQNETIIEPSIYSSVSYASTVKLIPFWKTPEFKTQIHKIDEEESIKHKDYENVYLQMKELSSEDFLREVYMRIFLQFVYVCEIGERKQNDKEECFVKHMHYISVLLEKHRSSIDLRFFEKIDYAMESINRLYNSENLTDEQKFAINIEQSSDEMYFKKNTTTNKYEFDFEEFIEI